MKLVYESKPGLIRIYENEDGSVVHEVRAQRATYRQVVTALEVEHSPDAMAGSAAIVLDAIIAQDFGGEAFGEIEMKDMAFKPHHPDAPSITFDVYRTDTQGAVAKGVLVRDYYRHYWPAPPEEEA